MRNKVCRLIILILLFFVFATACTEERLQLTQEKECNCIQEKEQIKIVAEYEHNRHDGRKDTIYIYSDNTYEWVTSTNGEIFKSYFFNAEELFEFAVTYKSNWNHNNWVKVER